MCQFFDVHYFTTTSIAWRKVELQSPVLTKTDYFASLRSNAYQAIAEARNRIRNDYGFYTEEEAKSASDFLRDLSNEARSKGKQRGDKPRAEENRKMLHVFFQLSQGMEYVLVNGVPVIDQGQMTGAKPGRVVRGAGYVP